MCGSRPHYNGVRAPMNEVVADNDASSDNGASNAVQRETLSVYTGPDWLHDEPNDVLLREDGPDYEEFKKAAMEFAGVTAASSDKYIHQSIREHFGTELRTLLGLRRMCNSLSSKKCPPERVNSHFLMIFEFIKTYARRRDACATRKVAKGTFDSWREKILEELDNNLTWVRYSESLIVCRGC